MTDDPPVFDASHFDELYRERPDPWDVRDSWYEKRKLASVLAALPRETYTAALELGCSIGATTRALAQRCRRVDAVDGSAEALRLARTQLADVDGVRLHQATLPGDLPTGTWDLVVMGEMGYFLAPEPLDELVTALPSRMSADGDLLAVHWRHDADRLPSGGDAVHALLRELPLTQLVRHEEDDFWLEVWRKP